MTVAALDTYDTWMVDGAPRAITDLEHALAAEMRGLARAWAVIAACPHKDKDDGTCAHPENPTPECHEGACPYAR